MSTKYGSYRTPTWEWVHVHGNPRVSDHLLTERWDQRTPPDSCSPEHAWQNGVDVSELSDLLGDKHGQTPDKAVYWSESSELGRYDVVLLACEDAIRTVYRVDSMRDEKTRTMLFALRELVNDE